jgi:hypothetical protein
MPQTLNAARHYKIRDQKCAMCEYATNFKCSLILQDQKCAMCEYATNIKCSLTIQDKLCRKLLKKIQLTVSAVARLIRILSEKASRGAREKSFVCA